MKIPNKKTEYFLQHLNLNNSHKKFQGIYQSTPISNRKEKIKNNNEPNFTNSIEYFKNLYRESTSKNKKSKNCQSNSNLQQIEAKKKWKCKQKYNTTANSRSPSPSPLPNKVISFINSMTDLQEAICKKKPNVNSMKIKFEIDKQSLFKSAQEFIKVSQNKINENISGNLANKIEEIFEDDSNQLRLNETKKDITPNKQRIIIKKIKSRNNSNNRNKINLKIFNNINNINNYNNNNNDVDNYERISSHSNLIPLRSNSKKFKTSNLSDFYNTNTTSNNNCNNISQISFKTQKQQQLNNNNNNMNSQQNIMSNASNINNINSNEVELKANLKMIKETKESYVQTDGNTNIFQNNNIPNSNNNCQNIPVSNISNVSGISNISNPNGSEEKLKVEESCENEKKEENNLNYVRECYRLLKSIYITIEDKEKEYSLDFNSEKGDYGAINYSVCYDNESDSSKLFTVCQQLKNEILFVLHRLTNNFENILKTIKEKLRNVEEESHKSLKENNDFKTCISEYLSFHSKNNYNLFSSGEILKIFKKNLVFVKSEQERQKEEIKHLEKDIKSYKLMNESYQTAIEELKKKNELLEAKNMELEKDKLFFENEASRHTSNILIFEETKKQILDEITGPISNAIQNLINENNINSNGKNYLSLIFKIIGQTEEQIQSFFKNESKCNKKKKGFFK